MTATTDVTTGEANSPVVTVTPSGRVPAVLPPPKPAAAQAPPPPVSPSVEVLSTSMVIVAALLFTFVGTITLLGAVSHARDQRMAFATLRGELANATALVGQTDENGVAQPLGRPMAVLEIKQIGVREVVFEGTTSGVLRSGPGHRRDSPLPGQAGTSVIYGRQAAYGGPFEHLDQLGTGQVFTITTGQGRSAFRVIAVRKAGDPQPPVLNAGAGRVTLITAAGSKYVPEGLLRVDADLVGQVQPNGPRPLGSAALPDVERPLAGDQSAWVVVLLLVQALLLVSLTIAWMRTRWGAAQVWLVGMPVVLALGIELSGQVARLLPNLM